MPTESPTLAELVADAKRMQVAAQLRRLPRPRTAPARIDLTEHEVRIPDSTRSLIDGFEIYGA